VTSEIPPGSPVFGDQINVVLTGDTTDPAHIPADSVVGILISELVPDTVGLDHFGSLEAIYRGVAAGVGSVSCGTVWTTVRADNRPTVLPIPVAFDLRMDIAVALALEVVFGAAKMMPMSRRAFAEVASAAPTTAE
jgi:hypothetical protein